MHFCEIWKGHSRKGLFLLLPLVSTVVEEFVFLVAGLAEVPMSCNQSSEYQESRFRASIFLLWIVSGLVCLWSWQWWGTELEIIQVYWPWLLPTCGYGVMILKIAAEVEASEFDKELQKVVVPLATWFHSRTFDMFLQTHPDSICAILLNSVNFYYHTICSLLFILARVDSVLCIRTWVNIPDQS